jgi:hypothetical protein
MRNRGMIYRYARVSTAAQDETGQVRQFNHIVSPAFAPQPLAGC